MFAQSISVDVGGTFTDFVVVNEDGSSSSYKSPTTPGHIADGIFNGIDLICRRRGIGRAELLGRCATFACGTTVATNAILEGKVARTGLICTDGFRDTLLIREGGKADTYNLYLDYPEPYIPRALTFGVRERVNAEGDVEVPLDDAQAREVVLKLLDLKVEAIAVSLLWSIANSIHEERIAEIIEAESPGLPYSLGHRVNSAIREYRRTSAAAIDASLKPIVQRNIKEIETRLRDGGFHGVLTFVTSSGGRASAEDVIAKPVYLCLSGPSAIAQAGIDVARREGQRDGNVIAIDMGGTSFDISISSRWTTPLHRQGMIGNELFGVPSVEVVTIGAGGGSIARVDPGGFIHVGPESAGANPGPACYGRGGTQPTVTDANLICGLLDPVDFADGQMQLSPDAAERAVRVHVAEPLGISVHEAASLMRFTAEQTMIGAIQDITLRRGIDPREYMLVSGGAAAGLHAAAIAQELGMREVVVPRMAGVMAAYGISRSDVKFSFAKSFFASGSAFDFERVNEVIATLRKNGCDYLDRMNVAQDRRRLDLAVEARYARQVWQLSLPLTLTEFRSPDDLASVIEDFHRLHEHHYAVRADDPIEFTEWTLMATGLAELSDPGAKQNRSRTGMPLARRKAFLGRAGWFDAIAYSVDDLSTSQPLVGPALIQDRITITLVPPEATARVTAEGSIIISLPGH